MVCLFSQSGKKIQVNSSKEKGREKKSCSTSVFFTTAGNVLRGGEKGGRRWKALFRCVFHHVVLTNYYFLCCVKNLLKKRVHRKRDRKDQPSFTEKAPLLEEYNSSYESLVCVCVFSLSDVKPLAG